MDINEQMRAYLRELGRRGGLKRSERKAEAARANGGLGGRPPRYTQPAGAQCRTCLGRRMVQDPISQEYSPCPTCQSDNSF